MGWWLRDLCGYSSFVLILGKLSDGLLAQASENHRRRRSLSKPSRWKPNVRVCSYFCKHRLLRQIRLLTPEHSISLQNSIGSDIIMQLDDVIQTTSPDHERMKEAMERSVRWLDRCIAAHKYPEKQNLFCIIQGGLDLQMRRECCLEMVRRDTPGIAIGGLSGGEAKDDFCKV